MSQKATQLPVQVGGGTVGEVGRSSIHRYGSSFSYDRNVPEEQALSLVMPVRTESYDVEGLTPIFQQNMPEGALLHELNTIFSKVIKDFDTIDLLGIVGPHQLGRVTVGHLSGDRMPEISVHDLLVHSGAENLFEDLLQRYARYSGVSGVQPKILVTDSEIMGLDRVTHRGATHIVKAWKEDDYPELAANEYFCLLAAEYAGLQVPKVSLSDNGKLLVVERFDVEEAGGYLGFEDLNSLLGRPSHRKYDTSYEKCAKQLKDFVSPEHLARGLESLFMMVALSAGVRGGDFHSKNAGLLYRDCGEDSEVWLAPAFDIVTTTPYKPQDIMALELAGSKNWPKHKLMANFGRVACQLTEGRCRDLLEQVADGMAKARAEMVGYMQDHPSFQIVGEKMLKAWELGPARSLLPENRAVNFDLGASAKPSGPTMG